MRTLELRVYTLRTQEVLDFYAGATYPRYINSFPQFEIEANRRLGSQCEHEARSIVS